MRQMYRTLAGVCNIVFTCAMAGLMVAFWGQVAWWTQAAILLGCLWFPLIQPVIVYRKVTRQVASIPKEMVLDFSDKGMRVTCNGQTEQVAWKHIKGVTHNAHMLILMLDKGRGYILTNRVLGDQKESFYQYVEAQVKK